MEAFKSTGTGTGTDPCIQNFFKYKLNNSWIYSLFIAFFNSKNPNYFIKDFVDNLKVKDYEKNFEIIKIIQNLYSQINESNYSYDLINDLIIKSNTHLNNNKISNFNKEFFDSFINKEKNPDVLLIYLLNYVFDTISSNKITFYSLTYNDYDDYVSNESKTYLNLLTNLQENIKFKNINFINIYYLNKKIVLKDTIDELFLYSIIAYIGDYFVCYYKCNDNWYLYNSRGIDEDINVLTIKIGNLEEVIKNYDQIIRKIQNDWINLKNQLISALPSLKDSNHDLYKGYEQKKEELNRKVKGKT
jgi:hypothetical protein